MPKTFAQIQPGLALGFGIPFAFGVVYRICILFGWTLGTGFGLTWLVAELATIAALAVVVTSRERLTLGSVGYRSIEPRDLRAGAALLGWMLGLSAIVAAVYLHYRQPASGVFAGAVSLFIPDAFEAFRSVPALLALAIVVAAAVAEELAARGYGIERLRAVTGSAPAGAAVALILNLLGHLPLWGIRNAIVISPAEVLLALMYVRGRRLAPCVFAHIAFNLIALAAMALWTPAAVTAHRTQPAAASSPSEREKAIGKLNHALESATTPNAPVPANPKTASDFAARARADLQRNEIERALDDCNTAVKLEPHNREWLKLRGLTHSYLNDRDDAIADFSAMIALDPHDVEAYRLRSVQYYLKHDPKAAIAEVDTAIKIAPKDADNYRLRGGIYFDDQDYDHALTDFDTAIQLDPKSLEYLEIRAAAFDKMGQFDQAIADCDRMIAIKPNDSEPYRIRAGEYQNEGDFPNAIADVGEALERQPNNAKLYAVRAELETLTGRWADSHEDYEQVARLNPDDAETLDSSAWALATSTRPGMLDGAAAVKMATHACELTGWHSWRELETLAAAYADVGDFDSAVKWQVATIRSGGNPDPSEVIGQRGRLQLYQQGRVYREEDDGPKAQEPQGRSAAKVILALLAWVFLVTGIVTAIKKAVQYFRRPSASPAA
jgi:tetratricopeptide (TPR) repeat protein